MENDINDILDKKRAWQKGDKDRRRKDGTIAERKGMADLLRAGRAIEQRSKPDTFLKMPFNWPLMAVGTIILMLLGGWLLCGCAMSAEIPTERAVKAIIGEAENQGYTGMLAVADAIRNRGTLNGVYGWKSYRVVHHKYSIETYNMAVKAWKESARKDITFGATGWGNDKDVEVFRHSKWFPSVYFTAHIGDHWFYSTDN